MSVTFFLENNNGAEQLWTSDGTAAGTRLLKDFGTDPVGQLTTIGARAYLAVNHGIFTQLWTSDGTADGTVLVKDIVPGFGGSGLTDLTNVNGTLFFNASDLVSGTALWKSDGTGAGTVQVSDPGLVNLNPEQLTNVNGTVFFRGNSAADGVQLWKSDGTTAGTVEVKDIFPGGSNPSDLTNVNGALFFSATTLADGDQLWKSDGTAAGTVEVKDILPGGNATPADLTNVNGELFFTAFDSVHGRELWKSDGTAAGTVLVKDIKPGPNTSFVFGLTNVNGTLFFEADDGIHGDELWKSDGTAAGTVLVKDINPGVGSSSNPQNFVNVGGTAFFTAFDPLHGFELWKSDGTTAGTVLVDDITPGSVGSFPEGLTNVNGTLEFYAFDANSSTLKGLYRSDGTAAGTFEIATNIDDSLPIGFSAPATVNDLNGDGRGDVLWRAGDGSLADWSMNGGNITSNDFVTFNGSIVRPDSSFSVVGTTDFNGDGKADVLWRATDGTLIDWTMNGSAITSSDVVTFNGAAVKPDASFQIAGVGDFNGDTRSDILWRAADNTLIDWTMNGATITSSDVVTFNGTAVKPDSSFSVAGIGDFNGDNRRDVLWRSTSGEVADWLMNGSSITTAGDITFNGAAVRPDASFSVAGIGDFDHDGNSDILWRSTSGELDVWSMHGTTIGASSQITFNGQLVRPDATWHVVEVADFNGDNNADILWRNDNGALAEWLMNGATITQAVTPTFNGTAVSPDASFSTQLKPTNFG